MAKAITLLIAPFLSFTAEEVWEHLRKIDPSLPESVFLHTIPTPKGRTKRPRGSKGLRDHAEGKG
jgi:isoleucyl-tRNA synthetase